MKISFLSTTPTPLSTYHRIARVLIGMVMLAVSVIQIFMLPVALLIFAYWYKHIEYGGASSDTLSALNGGFLLFVLSHFVWVVASLMLVFKRVTPRSIWGTLCTLGGLVTYSLLYRIFGVGSGDTYNILLIIVFLHISLAVGAVYFSKKHKSHEKRP